MATPVNTNRRIPAAKMTPMAECARTKCADDIARGTANRSRKVLRCGQPEDQAGQDKPQDQQPEIAVDLLSRLSGHQIRMQFKEYACPRFLPRPSADQVTGRRMHHGFGAILQPQVKRVHSLVGKFDQLNAGITETLFDVGKNGRVRIFLPWPGADGPTPATSSAGASREK